MRNVKYLASVAVLVLSGFILFNLVGKAQAATPTFSYSDVLGQPNATNNGEQAGIGVSANGFDEPWSVKIDTVRHRLFVVDTYNNRIMVYSLNDSDELVDKNADYVLGQENFNDSWCNHDETAAADTLCYPRDMTLDETSGYLYVADMDNHRVVAYNTSSLATGMDASLVLGQADFTDDSYPEETTAKTLVSPSAITVDRPHNRLFVANSTRVSVFNIAEPANYADAVNFLGQPDGTSNDNNCNSEDEDFDSQFCGTIGGLLYDPVGNALFVSDSSNYRVLQFDAVSFVDNEPAIHVLGQPDLATREFNQATDTSISDPRAMDIDQISHRLYVSDAGWNGGNRVLIYNISSITDGVAADNVLGQADFESFWRNRSPSSSDLHAAANTLAGPYGLAFNKTSGKLFVADTFNNRVLTYGGAPYTNGEDAIDFLGQPSFMGTGENAQSVNANGFDFPSVTEVDTVNHRLFVADYQNERVLVYNLNSSNELTDKTPDNVLGQANFTSVDFGACPWVGGTPNQHSLCFGEGIFGGLAYDSINDLLFVTDGASSRIMIFDTESITNGEDAVSMIGQTDWDEGECNQNDDTSAAGLCLAGNITLDASKHVLYVADTNNHRVLQYDLTADNIPDSLGLSASAVIGQSDFNESTYNADSSEPFAGGLSYPNGISLDKVNHHLYVADSNNSRILSFDLDSNNKPTAETGQLATAVLGQPDLASNSCNRGEDNSSEETLCYPNGVSVDSVNHHLYVADSSNSRVLIYDLSPSNAITNAMADGLLGQSEYNQRDNNRGGETDEDTMAYPWGVTFDATSGTLYVADNGNNRIVLYAQGEGSGGDNDGIDDETEAAAPNDGDANNDGTADSDQGNVASLTNPVTDTYFTLQTSCDSLEAVEIGGEAAGEHSDSAYSYPVGLAGFHAICGEAGETATMTMYFYGSFNPTGMVLRKWDETYKTLPGAVFSNVTIGGQAALKVVYQITDGGEFDKDGEANGVIVDPVGPALSSVGSPNTGLGRR